MQSNTYNEYNIIWFQVNIFKRSKAGLNSEFSFNSTGCLTKAKESNLPHNLPIAGKRTDGFMPFAKALVQSETQKASYRILTQAAYSISNDDNRYTKRYTILNWHWLGRLAFVPDGVSKPLADSRPKGY